MAVAQKERFVNQTKEHPKPVLMRFKEEFARPRVGGEYDSKMQIRVIHKKTGVLPYIQTKEVASMGSTRTGERSNEH